MAHMKRFTFAAVALALATWTKAANDLETLVDIPDATLNVVLAIKLGCRRGPCRHPLPADELGRISVLRVPDFSGVERSDLGIRRLDGIEYAISLRELRARGGAISDVAPLAGLKQLERLVLSRHEIVDVSALGSLKSLKELNLSNNAISQGVSALGSLKSLKELNLSNNAISQGVSALGSLGSLDSLYLSNNKIADVSALGSLDLRKLDLSGNEIADVSGLGSLSMGDYVNALPHNARALYLSNNKIADVSGLGSLGSLDWLYLSNNAIADVSALGSLGDLERLYLSNNAVADVSALGSLESLRWLDLNNNKIADVSALRWLESLGYLDLSDNAIADVSALGLAPRLNYLDLSGNEIADVSALGSIGHFDYLDLSDNAVADVSALGSNDELRWLDLSGNEIADVSALGLAPSLNYLDLSGNEIADVSALGSLESLWHLDLSGNRVTDLTPLAGLVGLGSLFLNDNQVTDLTPLYFGPLRQLHIRNNAVRDLSPLLAATQGRCLAYSDCSLKVVDVRGNPLSGEALSALGTLRERGVTVLAGEAVPYFPAAGGSREGFARIINRSDADGEVLIEAVDDAGVRFGPARMDVGARRAVHFNSRDLENGNAAKGLRDGVGRPTAGDWRLEVTSSLDIEVLSYVRTDDGFVTAMHDVAAPTHIGAGIGFADPAPLAWLPFFNPGSNESQRSSVRVVNLKTYGSTSWAAMGYDDRGARRQILDRVYARELNLRPGSAMTLTAQRLESDYDLRDGHGKWQLVVPGFTLPRIGSQELEYLWLAMGLLESPTGHLANLSTAPDNAEPLAGGGARHRVPLFPAAGGARQGFVRVINRSHCSGDVAIEAVDDAGNRSGPVRLELRGLHAAHFNSQDLEAGNAAKGLSGGVGMGEGDWRLELTSALYLQVLSYVRTADGFVTSMHDLAPRAADGSHRVVFFNPGSNPRQVSKLRLVNDGDRAASATIAGTDDGGSDSGTVAVTVPAGQALTFTSAQLEAGGGALSGGLGDGSGKWRLRVESDEPLSVMSLLESPTGHLANVSTGTEGAIGVNADLPWMEDIREYSGEGRHRGYPHVDRRWMEEKLCFPSSWTGW